MMPTPLRALLVPTVLCSPPACGPEAREPEAPHFLFSYFTGNGEDGLHLAHMVLKDVTNLPLEPQKNLRLAFAERATGPYTEATEPITGDFWAEGPTPLEIDGRWHIYFDKYRLGEYGVVVSDDLVEWVEESDRLTVPEEMRHGTAFRAPAAVAEGVLGL